VDRVAEAHVHLDSAVGTSGAEPDRGRYDVAFLLDLLDVDLELLPRLMHLAPELPRLLMAAKHGRQVGKDAGRADLDVGLQQLEPGVAVAPVPGVVTGEEQFGIRRHRVCQLSRWPRALASRGVRVRSLRLRHDTLRRIEAGEVTLAFRRWRRPTVKAGGRLRTAVGVLAIESVEVVEPGEVTDADARRAGRPDRAALLADVPGDGTLYRVELSWAGPDPRIALRERAEISPAERDELDRRLARLDAAGPRGPWTAQVLGLISEQPARRAPDLAQQLGRETAPFKRDVRKLKELGLTESLEVGYRLSPRGRAYLAYSRGR
jgi:hypothetical protein